MTSPPLAITMATYSAGLEAALTLLRQLERLSDRQRDALRHSDLSALNEVAEERERLMGGLLAIEQEIRPMRQHLFEHRAIASRLEGFSDLVLLHRAAGRLVADIMARDQETLKAMRDAEIARGFAGSAIEEGRSMLAAYRRVLVPRATHASLLDRRG